MKVDVVNKHKRPAQPGDIYIGRRSNNSWHFGNPYTHLTKKTRAEVQVDSRVNAVEMCRLWLDGKIHDHLDQERRHWILDQIDQFAADGRDLTLVCFCKPLLCHGDDLAKRILTRHQQYVGWRIQRARVLAGMTRSDASTALIIPFEIYIKIEDGTINPDAKTLLELVELYECDLTELLRGPLPYKSPEEALAAYLDDEIGESALAGFLRVHLVQARRIAEIYETDTTEQFRMGWRQAMEGKTHPIEDLFKEEEDE